MVNESNEQQASATPLSPAVFQNMAKLEDWLIARGIDLSTWGQGSAKSVENLWNELESGEAYLQDNPVMRVLPVTQVIIRKGRDMLIEAEQEFADQRRRIRNYPPSEKMKPGETYEQAAVRCLQEELGLEQDQIEILTATHYCRLKEHESLSYPGLWTRYIFHTVEARVRGLPETDFATLEAVENDKDAVRKHYWIWRK